MPRCLTALLLAATLDSGLLAAAPEAPQGAEAIRGRGSYAVVVSRATYADPEWRQVVDALREKHDASVIIYPAAITEASAALRAIFPRYACFVARPTEAGRDFVVSVHRLTRKLDEDPYTDVIWGILTGYEAADALRIARLRDPLVVRRAAAGTGMNLDVFDEGRVFSEGERGVMFEKLPGGKPERKSCPPDSTQALVDTFNLFKPDLFLTSGHATFRDWQIGYSYPNGQFRCQGGQLVGIDLARKVHPINSSGPRVYLPAGNCLIGEIPDREAIALAFIHTGGVAQMFGYVVATWYGYGGWGVRDLFIGQPGRFTLAEAFYLNNQALIHRLETEFPRTARVDFGRFDLERNPRLLDEMAAQHGLRNRDEIGLLWDRDTVAFYGDPAWDARLAPRPLAWDQKLTEKDGVYTFLVSRRNETFEITASSDTGWSRPPMVLFPHRLKVSFRRETRKDIKILEGSEFSPLITDNFLLLPNPKKLEKGKTYRVAFRADTM